MKKTGYILFLLLIISACSKEKEITKNDKEMFTNKYNIGNIHNNGLSHLGNKILNRTRRLNKQASIKNIYLDNKNTVNSKEENAKYITANSLDFINNTEDFANIDLHTNLSRGIEDVINTTQNLNEIQMNDYWNLVTEFKGLEDVISSREREMVSEIQRIFTDLTPLTLTNSQLHAVIKNRLEALKEKHANIIFEDCEGELFLGAMEIALYSTDFWSEKSTITLVSNINANRFNKFAFTHQFTSNPQEQVIETPGAIIQADIIGYLFAWGGALWNDSQSEKGVRAEDQYSRIGTGLWGAMGASTGRLIKPNATLPVSSSFLTVPEYSQYQ